MATSILSAPRSLGETVGDMGDRGRAVTALCSEVAKRVPAVLSLDPPAPPVAIRGPGSVPRCGVFTGTGPRVLKESSPEWPRVWPGARGARSSCSAMSPDLGTPRDAPTAAPGGGRASWVSPEARLRAVLPRAGRSSSPHKPHCRAVPAHAT